MQPVFNDPTPRWVPYTAAGLIVVMVWVGGVWDNLEVRWTTQMAIGLAAIFFVLIFFQGRFFWKGQVERLRGDGAKFEAVTMRWMGRGQRVPFTPAQATGWRAVAKRSQKPGESPVLSEIAFVANDTPLQLSFLAPEMVDLDRLSPLAPAFFAKVRADFPGLGKPAA